MNKCQKEVLQTQLDHEKEVIDELKKVYEQAQKDIEEKIQRLTADELTQSKIYQIEYQKALQGQIGAILENLNSKSYESIHDYLKDSYENAFIGNMYDLQGQGIPLIIPINQEQVVKAIQLDSKLSGTLYEAMGVNVKNLKKRVASEVSRGISNSFSYRDMARNLNNAMGIGLNKSIRIARTEAHRVSQQSTMDAMRKAKDKGADVVKQWDATLDAKTRPSHQMVDGEIRELDKPFSNGLMFPGDPHGSAGEVVNCRCVALQRAKWALDEDELDTLKERAEYFGLDKSENFDDFKKKYLEVIEKAYNESVQKVLNVPIKSSESHYDALLTKLNAMGVEYIPVQNHLSKLTNDEIISILSGGDKTTGSCASLGLAYIGQKQGWNVLDFRGGSSTNFFANSLNLFNLSKTDGLKTLTAEGKSSLTVGNRLLKQCEAGKEYYLAVGKHVSIVRKLDDGTLQYLELQSAFKSGWANFDGNPKYTLKNRFGCTSSPSYGDFMIDIDESDFSTDDFKSLLGYLNTAEDAQRRGTHGTIK